MDTENEFRPREPHPEQVRNPHVRFERRQMNVRLVFLGIGLLVVFAVLVHLVVLGLATYLENGARRSENAPSPVPEANTLRLPPEPRLQPNPVADLEKLRAAEDHVLNSYAWIDRNAGVVRIPLAEAMKIAAQRGLPKAQPQPQQAQGKQQK